MRLKATKIVPDMRYKALIELKDLDTGQSKVVTAYQCVYAMAVEGTKVEGIKLTHRGIGAKFQGNNVEIEVKIDGKLRKAVKSRLKPGSIQTKEEQKCLRRY